MSVSGHGPFWTCRPPKCPNIHIFSSFLSFVLLRHVSQIVCHLVAHRWALTSVLFFPVFCPVSVAPAPGGPESKWANRDNEQVGCHLPESTNYSVPKHAWSFARLACRRKIVRWSIWERQKALLYPYWHLSKQEAVQKRSLHFLWPNSSKPASLSCQQMKDACNENLRKSFTMFSSPSHAKTAARSTLTLFSAAVSFNHQSSSFLGNLQLID